jgi:uncharacterized protein (TIGR02147 family)
MTDIFTYLDYRKFLRDAYAEKKATNKNFSYRYLAQKTGLKSAGFFSWVLQGKRNLSSHLMIKFAEAFKLGKREAAYFELLVGYNQARTHEARKHFFDKIAAYRRPTARLIDPDQYEFYEQWYYAAIREWIGIHPFQDDYVRLAKSLVPPIAPAEAKKAVDLLERLGLIEKNAQGLFERKESTLTTGDSWKSLAITHYQIQSIDLAKQSLEKFTKAERDISTLTLSCSRKTFENIRERVRNLRQELAELVKNDPHPEAVYQCNFQVFPLAKPVAARPKPEVAP